MRKRTATAARRPACDAPSPRRRLLRRRRRRRRPRRPAAAGLDRRTRPGGAVSVVRRRRTSFRRGSVQTTARWCRLRYLINIEYKNKNSTRFFYLFVVIRALARGARHGLRLPCPSLRCHAAPRRGRGGPFVLTSAWLIYYNIHRTGGPALAFRLGPEYIVQPPRMPAAGARHERTRRTLRPFVPFVVLSLLVTTRHGTGSAAPARGPPRRPGGGAVWRRYFYLFLCGQARRRARPGGPAGAWRARPVRRHATVCCRW
jgi:hypothetical protein